MTMEIQKAIIGIGTSIFSLYLLNIFYNSFWENKSISIIYRILFYILFIGAWFKVEQITNNPLHFLSGWILYWLISLFFRARLREKLLLSCLWVVVSVFVEYTIGFILLCFYPIDFKKLIDTNIVFYLCGAVISKLILFMIVKWFQLFHQRHLSGVTLKGIFPIFSFPITSVITGLTIMKISPAISLENLEIPVAIIFSLLTCSSIYFIFVIENQARHETMKQRVLILEEQYRMQLKSYKKLYAEQKNIREIKHDLKNTLLVLSGMIKSGNTQEALIKISAIYGKVSINNYFVETNIAALDAVLSTKLAEASELGVCLTYQIFLPELLIDEMDFSILIANALDNALEACGRIIKSEKKINLNIHVNGIYILINTENPSLEPKGKSWKKDQKNHGIGLENMENIAKQYDGNLSSRFKDGYFHLSIMLKNKKTVYSRHY